MVFAGTSLHLFKPSVGPKGVTSKRAMVYRNAVGVVGPSISVSGPERLLVPIEFCSVAMRIDRARWRLKIASFASGGREIRRECRAETETEKGGKEEKNASGDRNRKMPIRRESGRRRSPVGDGCARAGVNWVRRPARDL